MNFFPPQPLLPAAPAPLLHSSPSPQQPAEQSTSDAIAHWHVSRMGTAIGQWGAGHAGNAGNVGVGAAPTKPSEKCRLFLRLPRA